MRISWSTVSNAAERSSRHKSVTSPQSTEHLLLLYVLKFPLSGVFYKQTTGSVEDHNCSKYATSGRRTRLSTTFDIKVRL